jgi:hypothetical protein
MQNFGTLKHVVGCYVLKSSGHTFCDACIGSKNVGWNANHVDSRISRKDKRLFGIIRRTYTASPVYTIFAILKSEVGIIKQDEWTTTDIYHSELGSNKHMYF